MQIPAGREVPTSILAFGADQPASGTPKTHGGERRAQGCSRPHGRGAVHGRIQGYLAGVFGQLRRLGDRTLDDPLSRVRPIRTDQRDLTLLTLQRVVVLMGGQDRPRG